ncbi:MAG: hypothetical protein BMS9Abin37_3269 [Acidobacteriota bacterium]|nr:MAG: hypothetical protein BMS9Abin37_3269 [Acidobacteriota bacterium]
MSQCSLWKSMLRIALVLSAFVPVGIAGAGQSNQPDEIDRTAATRGELTYRTYCKSCHGREARGDGALAKDLKVQPANLAELATRTGGEFPFEMVMQTIEHGRSVRGHGSEDMPAWGDAFEMTSESEAEAKAKMADLAHYLWSIQDK